MRVAIYARVSTLNNGQSPEMQLRELREYCERRGWTIIGEYVDLGISGAKEKRPELDRMMRDAHRRRFDVVAVWKFDRFARTVGKRDGRLPAFPEVGPQRLSPGNMFQPSFRETLKAFESIRIDSRARRNVLLEKGDDGLGLEIGDHFHSDAPRSSATLFHRDQNERRSSPLELPASAETGLLAANPRFINLYLAVQRLPRYIHHGPAELVKHHPSGLVTGQTELPLYQQGRHTTLVGGH